MKLKQILSWKTLLLIAIVVFGLFLLLKAISIENYTVNVSDIITWFIVVVFLTIIIISVRYRSDFSLPKPLRIMGWILFFLWIGSLIVRAIF